MNSKSGEVILEAQGLSKSYGEKSNATLALKNATFEVKRNEIFGLIGADGAGKTTLIRILATLLLADSGECKILGRDFVRDFALIRAHLGYMPAVFSLYGDLSVEENLHFFANIFNVKLETNYALIESIYRALKPFKTRRAGALSGGMKQKLALCCALIHKPKILLLDEPSTGVDALSRAEFWEILRILKSQMSIIVSTPYMDEAQLCDRVALMAGGEIFRIGSPSEIVRDFSGELFALKNLPFALLSNLRNLPQVKSAFLFGESLHLRLNLNADFAKDFSSESRADFVLESNSDFDTNSSEKSSAYLQAFLRQKLGYDDLEVTRISPNIEDCFMEFVNAKI